MRCSHRRILPVGLLAILLAVVGGHAAPASAAQVTELSYEIMGQPFGQVWSGAAVMGGTVTLAPKEGSLTTPCSYDALCLSYLAYGSGGFTIKNLTVTGSDSQGYTGDLLIGWGTLVPQTLGGPITPGGGSGYAFITPDSVTIVDFEGGSVRQYDESPDGFGPVYDVVDFGLRYAGYGTLFIHATDRFFDYEEADYVTNSIFFQFGLGNEVRTTVPEPVPSALVGLAVGLLVLAVLAGGG